MKKKFITRDTDFISHNLVVECDCKAHLLTINKFTDDETLSILHHSCSVPKKAKKKNLCWDIVLQKKEAILLANSILEMYSDPIISDERKITNHKKKSDKK